MERRKFSRGCVETSLSAQRADAVVMEVETYLGGCVGMTDPFDQSHLNEQYLSADVFALRHLYSQVATKYQGRTLPGVNPRKVAYDQWRFCEKICEEVNESRPWLQPVNSGRYSLFCEARRKIASILGSLPDLSLIRLDHGPGATSTVSRDVASFRKNQELPCMTVEAAKAVIAMDDLQLWRSEHSNELRLVSGSKLSFVPKTCKTDRPICIEPTINSMYQRAIGRVLKSRLLRAGCDLRDQGANRSLVRRCLDEGYVTVDFTSASDLISYEAVKWFLPQKWFELLSIFRSESYTYEGKWFDFHKFSSMGNGYTFELESLIFFALASAVSEDSGHLVSVFGDDVIVHSSVYDTFQGCVESLGFIVNKRKTFLSGKFFESCGLDCYGAQDVTPFRFKNRIRTVLDAFKACNAVYRWVLRHPCDLRKEIARVVYDLLLTLIPTRLRYTGPDGLGDNWLVSSDWTPSRKRWDRNFQRTRRYLIGLVEKPIKRYPQVCSITHAMYLCETWSPQSPLFREGYPLRGRTVVVPKLLSLD